MKSLKWKLLLGVLGLLSFNAYSGFVCYTVDKNNHFWKSPGEKEERACGVAMSFCTSNSPDKESCQIYKIFNDSEQG